MAEEYKRRAGERRKEFQAEHGYAANLVPDIWIGQEVHLNLVAGRGSDNLLGVTRASGLLEAIRDDGFVISVGDRIAFIPREAVLQLELYHEDRRGSRRLRLG